MIKHFYAEHQHCATYDDAFSHEIGGEQQVIISCYFFARKKRVIFKHDETLHCLRIHYKVSRSGINLLAGNLLDGLIII